MSFDPYEFDRSYRPAQQYPFDLYLSNTFLWMFLGLMITFGVAILCWMTGISLLVLYGVGHILVAVAQLVVVVYLSARIEHMSIGTARGCFVAYSLLTGLTISVYLYLFELSSLVFVFLLTAVFFGAMGAYGRFTQSDLSGLRPILVSGLIMVIVYGLLSLFLPVLHGVDHVMTLGSILLFLAFTAYDVQMIRRYYHYYSGYPDMLDKAAVFSALQLYLDFINLFLRLLRYVGRRRD